MSDKIKAHHLARTALLYVRQSSAYQVSHNTESRQLQYAMRQCVSELGWRDVEVIDEDLGRSASGNVRRAGIAADFVYVMIVGKYWHLPPHDWVERGAFMSMYPSVNAKDESMASQYSREMRRTHDATYIRQNAWSPSFSEEGCRFPTNREKEGQTLLNLWHLPSNFTPVGPEVVISEEQGEPNTIWPWLNLVREKTKVPATEQQHLFDWMAYTLQFPEEKINHMLMFGGEQGIGKDMLMRPVKHALGQHNTSEVLGIDFGDDHTAISP